MEWNRGRDEWNGVTEILMLKRNLYQWCMTEAL